MREIFAVISDQCNHCFTIDEVSDFYDASGSIEKTIALIEYGMVHQVSSEKIIELAEIFKK